MPGQGVPREAVGLDWGWTGCSLRINAWSSNTVDCDLKVSLELKELSL